MEKEKTTKIHEFDTVIYPFRLWVMSNPTKDFLKENFFCMNPSTKGYWDFEDNDIPSSKICYAVTVPVKNKKSKKNGALVMLLDTKGFNIAIAADVASHICDIFTDLMDLIGDRRQMFINGEPRAYIVQWAADCINKVKNNKIK